MSLFANLIFCKGTRQVVPFSILTHYNTTFMNSFVSFTRIQQCKPTSLHSFSQTQKPSTAQSLPPNQDHSSLEKNKRNVHNAYECLKMSSTIENNVCVSIQNKVNSRSYYRALINSSFFPRLSVRRFAQLSIDSLNKKYVTPLQVRNSYQI